MWPIPEEATVLWGFEHPAQRLPMPASARLLIVFSEVGTMFKDDIETLDADRQPAKIKIVETPKKTDQPSHKRVVSIATTCNVDPTLTTSDNSAHRDRSFVVDGR